MNFKALSPAHYYYFKNVLGITTLIRPEGTKKATKAYEKVVILNEKIDDQKQELLNKILGAIKWQNADIIQLSDLDLDSIQVEATLIFDRCLEDMAATKFKQFLVAPKLNDLILEPALKKPLWQNMQNFIKELG